MSVHGSREKLEQLKAYWLEGSWKICLELVRRGKLRQRDTCMHVGTALPPEHLAEGDATCPAEGQTTSPSSSTAKD